MTKINKIKEILIKTFKRILMIAFAIASLVGLFMLIRWSGLKGMAAFFAGMALMAYLLLSKNVMLMYIIESTKSEVYIDNIKEKEKEKGKADS